MQEREDRRASYAAWVLINVHRDTERKSEPYDFEEVVGWLGHGFQRLRPQEVPPQPPTPEELLERVKLLNQVYDGKTVNGSG